MTPKKRTVLLIEDNDDDIELTRRAFARSNLPCELAVARNGQEALHYLYGQDGEAAPQLPDMILLDLNLPKISGLDLLEQIKRRPATKRVPVIVLTTSTEEKDIVRSYDMGANSYVQKPVDFGRFLEAAKQLGQYWLALNEPPPFGVSKGSGQET